MFLRVLELGLFAVVLGSCTAGGTVADLLPQSLGGLPKNAPPRPGTPEYDEYRKRLEGKAEPQAQTERPNAPASAGN